MMSFEVEPGQKIGVVGKSGAGKSSLIKLFWRFLEPYSGTIEVDGVDILSYNLKDYRKEVSIVSQETCIFVGTLRENIDPKHSYFKDSESYKEEFEERENQINTYLKRLGFNHREYRKHGLDMVIEKE